jgi:hypothetical protein
MRETGERPKETKKTGQESMIDKRKRETTAVKRRKQRRMK